jgi:hypothetical protein
LALPAAPDPGDGMQAKRTAGGEPARLRITPPKHRYVRQRTEFTTPKIIMIEQHFARVRGRAAVALIRQRPGLINCD